MYLNTAQINHCVSSHKSSISAAVQCCIPKNGSNFLSALLFSHRVSFLSDRYPTKSTNVGSKKLYKVAFY